MPVERRDNEARLTSANYKILERIGQGAFGEVCTLMIGVITRNCVWSYAVNDPAGQIRALKRVFNRNLPPDAAQNVLREYQSLSILNHRNIVRLLESNAKVHDLSTTCAVGIAADEF